MTRRRDVVIQIVEVVAVCVVAGVFEFVVDLNEHRWMRASRDGGVVEAERPVDWSIVDAGWDAGPMPDALGGIVYTPIRYGTVDEAEWSDPRRLVELSSAPPLEGRAARLRRATCREACEWGPEDLAHCLRTLGEGAPLVEVP